MQIIAKEEKNIQSEIAYDDTYRFRLWIAAVDDSALLGMGFRAYHTHVMDSLALWKKDGVKFLNAKGALLNLAALQPDDLWGFLGKKEDSPSGPKRRINLPKFAILDVYFKKQYPVLAASFKKKNISLEFTSIVKSFLSKVDGYAVVHFREIKKIHDIRGVYIKFAAYTVKEFRDAIDKNTPTVCMASILMISHDDSREFTHLVVHSVNIPLNSKVFSSDFSNSKNFPSIGNLIDKNYKPQTIIFSGIGFPYQSNIHGGFISVPAIMRDRTTYHPKILHFEIKRRIYGFGEKVIYTLGIDVSVEVNMKGEYLYCGTDAKNDNIYQNSGYCSDFVRNIFNMYEELGAEV